MTLDPLQCRMARAVLDLTTRELAGRAGLPPSAVSRVENGQAVSAGRAERLRAVLEAAGIIFVAADEDGGAGIRLAKDFRRDFIFDGDGRHVANVVGQAVVDPLRDSMLATIGTEGVFTLDGEPLGHLGAVDIFQGTGSLPDDAMRLLMQADAAPAIENEPASLDLLRDRS